MSSSEGNRQSQPMLQQQQTVVVKKGGCGCGTCAIVILILLIAPLVLGLIFKIAILTAIWDVIKSMMGQ